MRAGMGVRLVVVLGCKHQIDTRLRRQGAFPRYVKGYRVSDAATLEAAVQAVSATFTAAEAAMSKV